MEQQERPRISYKTAFKGAQPKLTADEQTLRQISQLAGLQCTKREAGAVLGVCYETFLNFLKHNAEAREAWELGRQQGRASLRRTLWVQAQADCGQARFLAKQKAWLNMNDKVEVENTLRDKRALDRAEAMTRLVELMGKLGLKVVETDAAKRDKRPVSSSLTTRGASRG